MPFVPADLRIEVRWIAPMTVRNEVLENHSLMVRDGRILDILPSAIAQERYTATTVLQRGAHLLIPGMINTHSGAAGLLRRAARAGMPPIDGLFSPQFARDSILAAIAEMLKSGITCFSDSCYYPQETALAASEQGVRAVVGMPIADAATAFAKNAAQSLTRSLDLRDQYLGHPLVSMAFAPQRANTLSDQTFSRLSMLANELDAGVMLELQQSAGEIHECLEAFGLRPMQRLGNLGLLTPALNAVHMAETTAADIELAQRSGISISLCPRSNLKAGSGLPPIGAFAKAGIRLGLGSAGAVSMSEEIWPDMKLIALTPPALAAAGDTQNAWDILSIATRGGSSVLGLEDEVGTLQAGKWADLCCLDLSSPATQPLGDPLTHLVYNGGRDLVRDVWVAGRQLLADGELTRLDWAAVAARSDAWSIRMNPGG
jgi:5-methylthioadenosine/S-adenosylhomocysteine deaminase